MLQTLHRLLLTTRMQITGSWLIFLRVYIIHRVHSGANYISYHTNFFFQLFSCSVYIMDPPTSYLIPILQLPSTTPDLVYSSLHYLKKLYSPAVRGSRKLKGPLELSLTCTSSSTTAEGHSSARSASRANDAVSALETLRSDAFERSYAIRWLTALVSRSLSLGLEEDLIEEAASLLAACAGTASAGVVERVFEFQLGPVESMYSRKGDTEESTVSVKVRDTPFQR
jgi:hypothetical protein